MKNLIQSIFAIAFLCISTVAFAQDANFQEEMMKKRCQQKVKAMNDCISFMADKSESKEIRNEYMIRALKLFIGGGDAYTENGRLKEGVSMETTSATSGAKKKQTMKNYFNSLVNRLTYYSDVAITSTDMADIKVSNLKLVESTYDHKLYKCTCEYVQVFEGWKDGKIVYKDKTTKRIECYVELTEGEYGSEYIVMLGDVEATETIRLPNR